MTTEGPSQVKSLRRAIDIVEAVEARERAGVTDIATDLGVAKSTAYDHLKTLEANGFVVQEDDGSYRIGLRFLDHGGRARNRLKLYRFGKPEVAALAESTGELANLVIEEHGMGVYVDVVWGVDSVNIDTYVGKRELLHSTAVGKAILAHSPREKVGAILDRHGLPQETENTLSTRAELDEALETVRERGYAVDNEERLLGLCCVAAPIRLDGDTATGAISISGPTGRMQDDELYEDIADEVMRTANIIEVNAKYS